MSPTYKDEVDMLTPQKSMSGISLVELMISVALSIFLSMAIMDVTLRASRVNRQIQVTSEVIENGRYLSQMLHTQLNLAGFYGWLALAPAISDRVPNPCTDISVTGLTHALSFPVDGIDDAAKGQKICSGDSLLGGTDVLVIRRASTLSVQSMTGLKANQHYVQAYGNLLTLTLGGTNKNLVQTQKDRFTLAPIRAFSQIIYYVSNDHVFKRLRLLNGKYTPAEPLAEGVDDFQVEYGIDRSGDGAANVEGNSPAYVELPSSAQEWTAVVSIKYHLLLSSTDPAPDIKGIKRYAYADKVNVSFDDNRVRRLFTGVTQLMNVSARRSAL
tara:strand:- start:6428 stop:7411 length:984 start_codon:yes stop_codon:yes gene_type:complete